MIKKIFKYQIKLVKFLFWYSIYILSFFIPRRKNICVLGSYQELFNDNSKYLFIYICNNIPSIKAVWISRNKSVCKSLEGKGYKAYYTFSIKGIYYSLIAKYYIYNAYIDDINYFTSGGAVAINLWHGVGLKKIEFDIKTGPLSKLFDARSIKNRILSPSIYRKPNYMLSSAPFMTNIFSRAFRIKKEQCLEYGYPRNDYLVSPKEYCIDYIKKNEPQYISEFVRDIENYSKVYIYMPTWRDSGFNFFQYANIDLQELNEALKNNNELLLIKFHPNTKIDKNEINKYTNIQNVSNSWDIYPILPFTDILITDYSSIYYDYILMDNKQVILFPFDYEKYISERELNYDFDKYTVGLRANSFEQLLEIIKNKKYESIRPDYKEIIKIFWGNYDGNASERLASTILPVIGGQINSSYPK
jgi:CDP-glycerol glycerophosphotransferase (TagB/SpsB family)